VAKNLYRTAGNIGVDCTLRSGADFAGNPQAELVANRLRGLEHQRTIGVAYDLCQSLVVAEIDEDYAAMVAAPMRPAAKCDILANKL